MPAEQDFPCVRPNDRLPAKHFARLVAELVDEHLDLVRIRAADDEARDGLTYDPRLMALLLYAYDTGVCSSRMIERKCVDDAAFRWLTAGASPGYRAMADFRKQHLSALGYLLVQVLALRRPAAVVCPARLPLDRTRSQRTGLSCRRSRPS